MEIYASALWLSDLDEIVDSLPELDELAGEEVFITGGTGLIGSAAADILIRWNQRHDEPIRLTLAGRDPARIEKRFSPFRDEEWFHTAVFDAASPGTLPALRGGYILHCAGNATPRNIIREPMETLAANILGTKALLDAARDGNVRRFLFVSSSEIYGIKDDDRPFREDEIGYVELLNPRSSYPMGKRAAETLCAACRDEYGVDSVIVRPGHIYGPTTSETDNRVSSTWVWAAARGETVVLKSEGAQRRSYCYCLDCAAAIWKVMLRGESLRPYNISHRDSVITIREMAELISRTGGVELRMELPTQAEKKSFNPMLNSALDSTALESLGWRGRFDAERGFAHTVSILRELIR